MTLEEIIEFYKEHKEDGIVEEILYNFHQMEKDDIKSLLQEALYLIIDCEKFDTLIENVHYYHI